MPDLWGRPDPLDDQERVPPSKCACVGGWRFVTPEYADHMVAEITHEAERIQRRASALNSVFPCRGCRPVQFLRWAEQHWDRDHDIGSCPQCIEALGGKRALRRLEKTLEEGDHAR